MTGIWLVIIAVAASPVDSKVVEPASTPARTGTIAQSLRVQVSDALKREATSKGDEHTAAVKDLIDLASRLGADATLAGDERTRLERLVRSRLRRIADRLAREPRRVPAHAGAAPALLARIPRAEELDAVLLQQINQFGQQMARAPGNDDPAEALLELIKTVIAPESWEEQGGPGRAVMFPPLGALPMQIGGAAHDILAQFGAPAAPPVPTRQAGADTTDNGEELVALIQEVIAPESWDVAGGPGVIRYYRPLHVLVIRQTDEIHSNVGDVVGQLRAAGP